MPITFLLRFHKLQTTRDKGPGKAPCNGHLVGNKGEFFGNLPKGSKGCCRVFQLMRSGKTRAKVLRQGRGFCQGCCKGSCTLLNDLHGLGHLACRDDRCA